MSARISIGFSPAERSEPVASRPSFGLLALRQAPLLTFASMLPVALVSAAFGYLAYVCLMGWSGVQWL